MVERELPKLVMRVRFPLPAPINKMHPCGAFLFIEGRNKGIEPVTKQNKAPFLPKRALSLTILLILFRADLNFSGF